MTERLRAPGAAWLLAGPAVAVVMLVALFPLMWTFWESLQAHDLRRGGEGIRLIGLGNYVEAFSDSRFLGALVRTLGFTAVSVFLELLLGLALALALHAGFRGRGVARTLLLLPWAVPTVVAALVWRFLFEADVGALVWTGSTGGTAWFAHPWLAWVPVVLADVWKTTPFVALLLLAGLQGIDEELHDAAAVDGAGRLRRLWHVTLPLLQPTLLVALIFRTLDAMRVFDLVYVLTGGGPGTATEPLALYTFQTLIHNLRFGYGSALSVLLFGATFVLALAYVRLVGGRTRSGPS